MKRKSKRLNELDGKTWLKYSISVWREIHKTPEEKKLKHPAIFPISLATRLIRIFTHKGDVVLDPFMGSGTTVISAALEGRKGVGLDVSKEYCEIARYRITKMALLRDKDYIEPKIYNGDARRLLDYVDENSIDFCITSPPYWDILNRRRTADRKQIRNYSNLASDLGNISDYNEFLSRLGEVFYNIHKCLKDGKFCVVIVMDIRKKSKFYPFHMDLTNTITKYNFSLEDIIIWDRQHEYNNLRPLGYPYAFRVNKVHEYILIFKKVQRG